MRSVIAFEGRFGVAGMLPPWRTRSRCAGGCRARETKLQDPDIVADGHPQGLRWRLTRGMTARSRARRYERFVDLMRPGHESTILDVGVMDSAWRSSNFLEASYPWRERITAVALQPADHFERQFPQVRLVIADGRALPFENGQFDIGFSNAVVEHVGSRADQRRFISELVRTCRRVFIATPNAGFPVDPHTLLPFVHWLPRRLRHPLLHATRNGRWASEVALNPLTEGALIGLFPTGTNPRVIRQRLLGMTSVITAVTDFHDG